MRKYPVSHWNRLFVAVMFFVGSSMLYLNTTGAISIFPDASEAAISNTTVRAISPRFIMTNLTDASRFPRVRAGDRLSVTVQGRGGTTFKICQSRPGYGSSGSGCYSTKMYKLDRSGSWSTTFVTSNVDIGTWSRWSDIQGAKSNVVTYTVEPLRMP